MQGTDCAWVTETICGSLLRPRVAVHRPGVLMVPQSDQAIEWAFILFYFILFIFRTWTIGHVAYMLYLDMKT